MSKKTVPVVSSGSYSDYRVICACDTVERAEKVAAALRDDPDGWNGDAEVEELELVDYDPEQVTVYHREVVVWDDGTTSHGTGEKQRREWPFMTLSYPVVTVAWRWVRAPMYRCQGGRLEVWGTSQKTVAKVFSEKRSQALADPAFRSVKEAKGGGNRSIG